MKYKNLTSDDSQWTAEKIIDEVTSGIHIKQK